MRRVVALVLVALIGAALAGAYLHNSGYAVNGSRVSADAVRSDLTAITKSPSFECYLASAINLGGGATAHGFSPTGSANLLQFEVDGLSMFTYLEQHQNWHPTSAELDAGKIRFIDDLTLKAERAGQACPTSAESALATMPSSFVDRMVDYYAAGAAFVKSVPGIVPQDEATLKSYYSAHRSNYDTLCLSVAFVPSSQLDAFSNAQKAGDSVSELARKFSNDPSAAHGGAYGCFGPTEATYSNLRAATSSLALNTFPPQPQFQSGPDYVFVAVTSRTPNSFESVRHVIVNEVNAYNEQLVANAQAELVAGSKVSIDPAFAQWVTSSGSTAPLSTPNPKLTPFSGTGLS